MHDFHHRLPVIIFAVIVSSFMAAGTLWLATPLIWDRDRGVAGLAARTERGIKAAQAYQNAASVAQTVALLNTVIAVTPVTGAIILNPQGRGIQKIGDGLPVNSDRLRRSRRSNYQAAQGCCIDLFLKKSQTGLPYNLVVRIDTGDLGRGLASRIKQLMTMGLAILMLGSVISLAILYRIIILPLDRLRLSFSGGPAKRPKRNLPQSILTRKDVIGDLGRMIDPPNGGPSRGTPAPGSGGGEGLDLINEIPLEVLSFGADGALADANGRALGLFNCQSLSELQAMDLAVFQTDKEPGNGPCSLPEVMQNGLLDASVTVFCGQNPVPRRIIARGGRDNQGGFQDLVACLLPVGPAGLPNATETPVSNAKIAASERRAVKLKLILEACLTLMSRSDPAVLAAGAQPVRTDILVENWYLDASRGNLVDNEMEHCVPGQVVGDAEAVNSLIRHALTFVALRSEAEIPKLSGAGEIRSADLVEFVFEEVGGPPVRDREAGEAGSLSREGAKLPLAALTSLLAAYGGKVLSIRGHNDTNLIRFVMRARPAGDRSGDPAKAVDTKSAA